MATATTSRLGRATELHISKSWNKDRETSPERTKVWTEPPNKHRTDRKVPVVYYLCRNGQLEHPHFMEVPLSPSSDGLYLRDIINRLNFLRGKGMAAMYSWSSKRSYKNGFVWHDLSENDFIYPAHGQEYVLKGSELLLLHDAATDASLSKTDETASSGSGSKSNCNSNSPPERQKSGDEFDFAMVRRRRNQSWSAIDLHEYKVYKADAVVGESALRAAADASTQTDDKRRRRRAIREIEEEDEERADKVKEDRYDQNENHHHQSTTELSIHEISPPPSDSSPETLESLMKADGRIVIRTEEVHDTPTPTAVIHPGSGRTKASSVLMQLISCGSISFRDCGPGYGKDHPGFSLLSHYTSKAPRLPRGSVPGRALEVENRSFLKQLEDKEYFSGSLIETKKGEFHPALKRSSSYNADRTSRMELGEKEIDGVKARCIPRKPRTQPSRKDSDNDVVACSSSSCSTLKK